MIDPHTHQYLDRMKDEPVFLALASKASDYLGGRGEVKAQAKIALRRVEHFYYKTDTVYGAMRRMTIAQQEAQQQAAPVQQVNSCCRPYQIDDSLGACQLDTDLFYIVESSATCLYG